jgi:hypothetical protein
VDAQNESSTQAVGMQYIVVAIALLTAHAPPAPLSFCASNIRTPVTRSA